MRPASACDASDAFLISRREALVGIGSVALPSVSLLPSTARASAAGIALAAMALVTAVAGLFRKSGDLQLELQAINIKLDAINAGLDAIAEMQTQIASSLVELSKTVTAIPARTNALKLANDLSAVESTIAYCRSKVSRSEAAASTARLKGAIADLEGLSTQLSVGTATFDGDPILVSATASCFRSVESAKLALRTLRIDDQQRKSALRYSMKNVVAAYSRLSSSQAKFRSIPIRLKDAHADSKAAAETLRRDYSPYVSAFLPADFDQALGSTQPAGAIGISRAFKGTQVNRKASTPIWDGAETKQRVVGSRNEFETSTPIATLALKREAQPLPIDRHIFVFSDAQKVSSDSAETRTIVTKVRGQDETIRTEYNTSAKLNSTIFYDKVGNGEDRFLTIFVETANLYAAKLAYEAYLYSTHAFAIEDLKQAQMASKS